MIQAALPLHWPDDDEADSFAVTPSNTRAVRHLEAVGTWPIPVTLLTGPRKSGRSLLGRVFARRTGGRLLDDADRHLEQDVFRAWNDAQETRRPLLIVAQAVPPTWHVGLPDLASRLAATPVVALEGPDDAWIAAVVVGQLTRRGIELMPEVLSYIVPRAPRSHWEVVAMIDALDQAALARKGRITVPLARSVLGSAIDGEGKAG